MRSFLKSVDRRCAFALLAAWVIVTQLAALHYATGIFKNPLWNVSHVAALTHNLLGWLGDAIILTLPTLLLRRNWHWAGWLILALFSFWGVAQLMYFPTYCDLMPLSSFALWQNLDGLVLDSALGNWTHRDWLFVISPLVLAIVDVLWLRRLPNKKLAPGRSWVRLLVALLCFVALRVAADALAYATLWNTKLSVSEFVNDNYTHVKVSHASYLTDNGWVGYMLYCAVVELAQHNHLDDEEVRTVEQFLANEPQYTDNTYDAGCDNLILIIVESLNSWVVDLRVQGREVTPVLNALCADSSVIVCKEMRRQVKNGGSSDGHFMYNTGLLPLEQRAVAMIYPDTHYPTLIEAMGAKHTTHICADPPALWNTEVTAHNYGYINYHGAQEVRPLLKDNDWQWDKVIFERATSVLEKMEQPFVAQIITLGMHEPFTRTDVPQTWISHSGVYTLKVRNYLERTAVFDRELGLFIERLKRQGLYDNSLIVIASDHNDRIDFEPEGRPAIDPVGQNCLLLVLNSGRGMVIDKTIAQIDVFPTLLDLTGSNHYGWKGLGRSVMREVSGTAAPGPNDAVGTGPSLKRQQQAWEISRLMIVSRWFDQHPVNK